MSWMATKIFLKKAWSFTKNYWYIPAILVAILITFFTTRTNNEKLLSILKKATENHKKEIDIINNLHEEEIRKRDQLIKEHAETLEILEQEHNLKLSELDKKKKKEVDNIIEKFDGDTESLAKEISKKLGVEYVSNN
jgi:hypothetical protein